MSSIRSVEVVIDFVCVHSYIGFTRFMRAADAYRAGGGEIRVSLSPFQLRPDASPEGEPLFEVHKRERGEAAARQIASTPYGAADGLQLNFTQAVFTNTFHAHRVLAQAAAQGAGERLAERVFRAYFADGVNIADRAVLSRLAADVGVATHDGGDAALVAELSRVRQELRIDSVPVFRFSGGRVLAGEQSEAAFLAVLRG